MPGRQALLIMWNHPRSVTVEVPESWLAEDGDWVSDPLPDLDHADDPLEFRNGHPESSLASPGVIVRPIDAPQWQVLREVRLRALRDSPRAFLSSYEIEAEWTPAQWCEVVAAIHWVVAFRDGHAIGLAGALRDPDDPTSPHVVSMWVEPEHRRQRVASQLMSALMRWAFDQGSTELRLWVLDGNETARVAYDRMGFTPTGEQQAPVAYPTRREERMTCRLSSRRHVPTTPPGSPTVMVVDAATAVVVHQAV